MKELEKKVKIAKERNKKEKEKKVVKVEEVIKEKDKHVALTQGCIPLTFKRNEKSEFQIKPKL